MLAIVYIATLTISALVALRRRSWWLAAACGGWCAMAVMVTLGDGSEGWLRYRWLPAEWVSLAVSLAAVGIALAKETAAIESPLRFRLRFGAIATPISLVGLMWLRIHHNDWYWVLTDLRARAWQWAALALAIVYLNVPQRPNRDTLLLLWIALAHAVFAPLVHLAGPGEQMAYRAIAVAGCCWWLWPHASRRAPAWRSGEPRESPSDGEPPLYHSGMRQG